MTDHEYRYDDPAPAPAFGEIFLVAGAAALVIALGAAFAWGHWVGGNDAAAEYTAAHEADLVAQARAIERCGNMSFAFENVDTHEFICLGGPGARERK